MAPADPIVEEIRNTKLRLAARFNFDATKMLKDAQRRQARAERKVVAPRGQRPVAQSRLVAAARRAKQEIAAGKSEPLDLDRR
jgi:hypothetical protein